MRRIKVVNLTNHEISITVHMHHMNLYLKDQGYDPSIICNPGSMIIGDTITDDGFFVKAIPFPSKITPFSDLATLAKLVRYFRQEKFDIVHTHGIKPGLLGRMAARLARVPVVLYTIHGFHFHDEMHPGEIAFYRGIERFSALFCDMILSQNREDIETAVNMKISPREKVNLLGNGIDIRHFHPSRVTPERVEAKRRELGIPPETKVVCMLGRLVREKGFYEYFEAAKILKERGLKVVFLCMGVVHNKKGGIDPQAMIDEAGLGETVRFLGLRRDVADIMALMDVLVSASYAEGIPRNVMEASAMGKAIIATDVRGTKEIIEDGVNGLLIPVKDPLRLADAVDRILSDPDLSASLGSAARAKAEERMDERAFFRKMDLYYRQLLKAKRPGTDWESLLEPIPDK